MTRRLLTPVFLICALGSVAACDGEKKDAQAEAPKADAAQADEKTGEAKADEAQDAKPAEVAKAEGIPEGQHDEGCLHGGGDSCDHKAAPADGAAGHFGAPFSIEKEQPLSAAIASFAPDADPVLVSGEVKSVCKAKGCWMVIEQGEMQARVLMKDHSFAVPMDGEGSAARVQGVLSEKTLSEAQVKHIEKDAGRDPEAVKGERKEYILTATGVELTRS